MKIKVRDTKGITLIALVITIVVILILASVGTYSGIEAVNIAKLNRFITEMKMMQTEVNKLYDKYKNGGTIDTYKGDEILNIGKDVPEEIKSKIFSAETSGITDSTGYRYFDSATIKTLEIEEIEEEFLVNISKRSIISTTGLKYNNNTYYTLEQLPNSLYNVEYDVNTSKPDFNIKSELIGEKKYKVTIEPTNNVNIQKWEVKYQLDGDSYWNTSDELTFNVEKAGKYNIKIQNGDIESEIKSEYIGYVAEGMVLHYDGIINTRNGSNKSTEINTWEDLSGNRNDATIYDCIIDEDSIEFNGSSSYGKLPNNALGDYKASTIEVVINSNINDAIVIADNSNISNRGIGFNCSANKIYQCVGNIQTVVSYYFIANKNILNTKHTFTLLYDGINYEDTITYLDNVMLEKSNDKDGFSNNSDYPIIGKRQWNSGGARNFLGNIYSIRVYNRMLTDEEVKINYEIDKTRFNIQ